MRMSAGMAGKRLATMSSMEAEVRDKPLQPTAPTARAMAAITRNAVMILVPTDKPFMASSRGLGKGRAF